MRFSRFSIMLTMLVAFTQLPHEAIADASENQLKIIRSGRFGCSPNHFNEAQTLQYGVFKQRCSQCHEISRPPLRAVESRISPVSHQNFGLKEIKRYVIKMMRKPNSGITKPEPSRLFSF